jgi:3',5'-cyclic AMP phosphodiesterase CpdA
MFESRIGESYYTFDHKGWKFLILNSVEDTRHDGYIGLIDKGQIEWIKEELGKTDTLTPIIISTHIPFITAKTQKYQGATIANDSSSVISNGKEVLDLFKKYNLKLVLQGHLHTVEDIYIDGIHFVTGGAVSAAWWKGPNQGTEEGFMLVSAGNNEVNCRYIDYGWNAEKQ